MFYIPPGISRWILGFYTRSDVPAAVPVNQADTTKFLILPNDPAGIIMPFEFSYSSSVALVHMMTLYTFWQEFYYCNATS